MGSWNSLLIKIRGVQATMYTLFINKIQSYEFQLNQLSTTLQEPILINKKISNIKQLQLTLDKIDNKIINLQQKVAVLDRVLNSFSVKILLREALALFLKKELIHSASALNDDTYNIEFLNLL